MKIEPTKRNEIVHLPYTGRAFYSLYSLSFHWKLATALISVTGQWFRPFTDFLGLSEKAKVQKTFR